MARSDAVRLGLTMRLHESAKGVVAGLLNGALMGYPRERLAQLIDATRTALGDARLPEVWGDALLRLESLVESGAVIDEAQLIRLLQAVGMDASAVTELIADNTFSADAAPDRAREYAHLVWAGQIRSLASRIYSAAGEANLDELTKLLDELPALVEQGGRSADDELRPETPFELRERAETHIAWYWYEVIPQGGHLTVLSGREKRSGKSTLLIALLSALLRGEPFLGRQTGAPDRIVLLSEESRPTLRRKLDWFETPDDPRLLILSREQFRGGTRGALQRHYRTLERLCLEHPRCLLVCDTWQAFTQLRGSGENDVGAVLAELEPLLRLTAQGVSVLLVHHAAKLTNEARGSTGLTGAADNLISILRKDDASGRCQLTYLGRFGAGVFDYEFDPDSGEYTLLGAPDESDRIAAYRAVRDALADGSWRAVEELVSITGLSRPRVAETLRRMVEQGQVERRGDGRRGSPYEYRAIGEIDSIPIKRAGQTETISLNESLMLDVLREMPDATSRALAERLGVSERRVQQVLSELCARGIVQRSRAQGHGYTYSIVDHENPPVINEIVSVEPFHLREGNESISPIAHADLLYPDDASVSRAFEQWLANMRGDGLLQLDADDERLVRAVFERAQAAGWPALYVRLRNGGWRNLDATRWSWLHAIQTLALDGASLEDLLHALDAAGSTHRASHTHTESIPLAGKGDDAIAPPPAAS